jgi:Bacterial EndoU nuclease
MNGPEAKVSRDRRTHILDGDATGGGHRNGAGRGKSEFPPGWSDDKIIDEIESVANDPDSQRSLQPNGRTRVEGTRDGIDIRVIVDPDGASIRTGHPLNQ